MCVWVKLCSHGEMYLPAATSLHIHEQLRHSGKSAAVRWGNKCTNTILCLYISWQKISGKNPACCKNLCSNLAYLPPLSLTKYANVIGPPLLANAWIWPQENGVKGTYLHKCFFSYCKNDRRQSDYLFFLIKLKWTLLQSKIPFCFSFFVPKVRLANSALNVGLFYAAWKNGRKSCFANCYEVHFSWWEKWHNHRTIKWLRHACSYNEIVWHKCHLNGCLLKSLLSDTLKGNKGRDYIY